MRAEDELVLWLRALLEYDLEGWRSREVAYLPRAEHEDKWLYRRAREQAARCEAELALLDLHTPVAVGSWEECGECGPNNRGSTLIAVPGDGDGFFDFPCQTLRVVGYGYRFRPGYREAEWKA